MICLSPGTSEKTAQTNLPDWISTWAYQKPPPWSPSQSKCRTIRTLACSLVEGIASTAVPKLLFRYSLSPKWPFWTAAILDCISGIYGNYMRNHAMISGTEPKVSSPRLSKWHLHFQAEHASGVSKSGNPSLRPSKRKWTAGKPPASAVPNVGVSHGIARYHWSRFKRSLNFWS